MLRSNKILIVTLIILLISIAQLGATLCLASLPNIVSIFNTNVSTIQLAIPFYTFGIGLSQFFYGPLSDSFGRKNIALFGVGVFILGNILSILIHSVSFFLCLRFAQGIGMGASGVTNRAVICDVFEGNERARIYSIIAAFITFTPLVSPLLGGYLQQFFGWQSSFTFLFIYSSLIFISWYIFFPETNKNRYVAHLSVRYFFKNYAAIFGNALFNRKLLCSSLIYAGEIILITVSPFIIQSQLDFSSSQFGLIFAFVILGFMCGAFTSAQLLKKFTSEQVIKIGLIMALIDTVLFVICSLVSVINIVMVTIIMGGFMFSAGFVYPNIGAQIIGIFPDKAGSAGAAMGATQALLAGTLGFLLPYLYKGDSNFSISVLLLFIVVISLVVYHTTRSFKLIDEKESRTFTTH